MSRPRSFQQVRHAIRMLTNTLTEDELISKKVTSLHHLEVVRFCTSRRGAPINFTDPFARFTACSKWVCRWNTVTYMLHVIL
ncbi:hypothetical protein LDENG_00242190 [Lucifuga dentata]|nr:hypothetical protein LDENG_00242190 [Lucifuga dentata]